jgi:tetratricopeptide (TPR) repeat protein
MWLLMKLPCSRQTSARLPGHEHHSDRRLKAAACLTGRRLPFALMMIVLASVTAFAQNNLPQASVEHAAALIRDNRLPEADRELDKALKMKPNDANALNLRGAIRAQQGKLNEAEILFLRAVRLNSELPAVHMNLARLYLLKSEPRKTVAELREVLRLDPANSEAFDRLAALLLSEGEIEECISFVERAKQSQPLSPALLILLGDAYLKKSNADRAEENYQQAITGQSDNTDAVLGLAQVALLRGQTETAASYIARSRKLAADSPATLYRFALVTLKAGDSEEANAAMMQAVKLQPNNPAFFLLLGTTWLQKPDLLEAEKAFRRSLELYPRNPQAQMSLGYTLLMQKQYPEAKLWLEKSVQLDPGTAETFYYLGLIAQEQNEDERAVQHFKKALELVPSFGHAHVALGSTYLKLKNYSAALEELTTGVKLNPEDSTAHYNLAVLYARLKDQQRAQEEMQIVEKLKSKKQSKAGDTPGERP